jgi:arylformamidase
MNIRAQDPFRIRDHVAAFDNIVTSFRTRSAATRTRLRFETVQYGPSQDETLDIFFPRRLSEPAPVHIFVHGGYWRMFSKDDYSYIADTVTSIGAIAVVIDYALMPHVRMMTLIDQVRAATDWVVKNIASRGGDPSALTVSGHSAGAHLACWLLDEPGTASRFGVKAALLLGGIYDLAPLRHSFLQGEIHLTNEEIQRFTPIDQPFASTVDCAILVGEQETPPFHDQALRFQRRLNQQGARASLTILKSSDHMSSVLDLGSPETETGLSLIRLIQG